MLRAIKDGRIPVSRLNESVLRSLRAKANLGLHKDKFVNPEDVRKIVGNAEHREMAREIHEKALVLVRNEGNIIPLQSKTKSISVLSVNDDGNHLRIGETFINEVNKRGNVISEFFVDPNTLPADLTMALEKSGEADVVVVGLFARVFARRGSSSLVNQSIIQLLGDLERGDAPVIVVSFGSPYLVNKFPEVDGYMISTEPSWEFYGYDKFRPGQIAAARAIFGEIGITGKLAVSIPGWYSFGQCIIQQ